MQDTRQRAYESYGIDLADQKWKEKAKQRRLNLVEGVLLLMAANLYLVLEDCQAKLDAYASDTFLSGEEMGNEVCTAGIAVLEATEAVLLHVLTELLAWAQSAGGSEGRASPRRSSIAISRSPGNAYQPDDEQKTGKSSG